MDANEWAGLEDRIFADTLELLSGDALLQARAASHHAPSQAPPNRKQEESLRRAHALLRTGDGKRRLCAALHAISEELHEVVKAVMAAFVPLALAHNLPADVDTLALSGIAFLVVRSGVATFCAGLES